MNLLSMEVYTFELFSGTTCFWICSVENDLSLTDCTFSFTQKDHVRDWKVFKNKVTMWTMSTSILGWHFIEAEMNAESL